MLRYLDPTRGSPTAFGMLRKAILGLSLLFSVAAYADCELDRPVRFAGLDWDSNRILTEIARRLVEEHFGCDTRSIPGQTYDQFDELREGDLDVMMEVWETNFRFRWRDALESVEVRDLGPSIDGAVQGWFVPRYLVEGDAERDLPPVAPELKSVADLPKYKHLFRDPENPRKGRFYNCPLGWSCEVINSNKLRAYELQRHYSNYRSRDGEKLQQALLRHYQRAEPFVTYYWGPSWLLASRDLLRLEEPAYEEHKWGTLMRPRSFRPEGVAYPSEAVRLGVNAEFADQAPQMVAFFKRFSVPQSMVSDLLADMRGRGISAGQIAQRFIDQHPQLWQRWLGTPAE